ncbi:type II toxin-antitoxin system RelE/ParE family toxin [Geminisphaera colitermitum]|uniref:type II toxin-antitoxin system RelE/ParE family toxin n=1 Tax=Geminisphaera colitermitum TaxID=1148786 RepID=UPI0005B96973|nr:type II toxin-antitoxin system RelE/ParE family toxin [Geminisphaera colitermitum]
MKNQPVEALDIVAGDLQAAYSHYNTWHFDGEAFFQNLLDDALYQVQLNPEIFAPKYKHFRRVILHHSYYAAYYVIEPDVTTVVAILDQRQDPQRIQKTLNQREPLRHLAAKRRQSHS